MKEAGRGGDAVAMVTATLGTAPSKSKQRRSPLFLQRISFVSLLSSRTMKGARHAVRMGDNTSVYKDYIRKLGVDGMWETRLECAWNGIQLAQTQLPYRLRF